MRIRYSGHAQDRMEERFISKKEVMESIERGSYVFLGKGEFEILYRYNRVIVCDYGKYLKVVTVTYTTKFNDLVFDYIRENRVSYKKAVFTVKELVKKYPLHIARKKLLAA